MIKPYNFSNYEIPELDFGIENIISIPKVRAFLPTPSESPTIGNVVIPKPTQIFSPVTFEPIAYDPTSIYELPPVYTPTVMPTPVIEMPVFEDVLPKSDSVNYAQNIKKTISFTVADDNETLPGANIAVDGIGKAQTDINGNVTIPNISLDASIKITYVGYDDYITTASTIPSVVILKKGITMLSEVVVEKKSPKASSNNSWMWWIILKQEQK